MNIRHTTQSIRKQKLWIKRRTPFQIWILSFLLLGAVFFLFIIDPSESTRAKSGILNASHIDNKLPVALNGEWEYYDGQFLFPSDFSSSSKDKIRAEYRTLPGTLPANYGYGTYRLNFTFLSTAELYSIRLSGVQGTARVYVDGLLIADVGFTSSLKESSESSKDNQYIVFPLDIMRRSHEIIIQTSNFSNYCFGITSPVYFGTQIDGYRLSSQFKFAESVGLMSVSVLAILLVFILVFRIQMGNMLYLLLFTITLLFHLVYSSNDLLTQPVQSWSYLLLTRLYIICFGLIGFFITRLAGHNENASGILYKLMRLHRLLLPMLVCISLACPNNCLPLMKMLLGIYFLLSIVHASITLAIRIYTKSYSALMQMLALCFCGSYFLLQYLNSRGMVTPVSYTYSYIFLLVAYVTSELAYVALQVSRIYTGNARLAHRMVVADKLKSEFISATSHELRTPLHGIINIIESACSRLDDPDTAKDELTLALTLTRRMNSVIHDLYGFYSTSERLDTGLRPVNLDIEVNAVIEVFHYTVNNDRLTLKNRLSPDALWVNADESRLWEVLNNIIGNSVKYTDAGTVTITSKREDNKIYLSVTDTGIGMSAREMNRIFDKSVRLEDAAKRTGGTGYGLYLAKQLVEQMNGSIYVEWVKPEIGTSITFCLDACDPKNECAETTAADQSDEISEGRNFLENFHGDNASMLVVDDNLDNLNIIRTIFDDCSFSIDCVQNASDALRLMDKHTYDIIILDVMMPDMSGFEMCQTVRKRYSHFELPVLLLTACDSTEEILTGFWSGANDYVVKPADRIELRTRVFSLITLRQSVKAALENEMLFLQAQIRPHFLYNAFNTISAVALTDGLKASSLIDDLAAYLRGCFGKDMDNDLVTIETELGIVNSYVRIEQARFGNRLHFIQEIQTDKSFFLPPLTVQPLVENAIRHATLGHYGDIQLKLTVMKCGDSIHIIVKDNGNGMEASKISSLLNADQNDKTSGIGLKNVNRRLNLHYGIPLEIRTSPGNGTEILIRIPLDK